LNICSQKEFEDSKGVVRTQWSEEFEDSKGVVRTQWSEEFEDSKGVVRTQWSEEKGQKDKQRCTKHTHTTGCEVRCSGRASSCCSISGTRYNNHSIENVFFDPIDSCFFF
jgi:hypothetical protein